MTIELVPGGRVWIFCRAGLVSGGPEALHQLSLALSDRGVDVRMVYYRKASCECVVPEQYGIYRPKVAAHAEDREGDVIIVPESFTGELRSFKKSRRIIWWLSVDNYSKLRTTKQIVKDTLRGYRSLKISDMSGIDHLCQSFYAREYLEAQGIKNTAMLTDYLRDEFLSVGEPAGRREDIVLYYPKKGLQFTRMVMSLDCGRSRWVALEGMQPAQVAALMRRAKLYVDFGHHPGRDRIPREAAISGCCVLTGKKGSAGNDQDVPIPTFYKVDERLPGAVEEAVQKIGDIVERYERHRECFSAYRDWIAAQKKVFLSEVRAVFS